MLDSTITPVSPATGDQSGMPLASLAARHVSPSSPIRILIADDHPMVRDGLRALLVTQPDFAVVGDARDGEEALRMAYEMRPDVLLLDLAMPHLSGLEVLRELNAARTPPCRTILVTAALQKLDVARVLRYGARGIVLKDSPIEMVFKSIRKVHDGEVWVSREAMTDLMDGLSSPNLAPSASRVDYGLTPREREVLVRLVEGDTNKEIAERLSVSEGTVKHHLTSIFTKTGATNRLELGLLAVQRHLVPESAAPQTRAGSGGTDRSA